MEFPEEAGYDPALVGPLLKSMYGTRDAGQNWELDILRVMRKLGFQRVVVSACVLSPGPRLTTGDPWG